MWHIQIHMFIQILNNPAPVEWPSPRSEHMFCPALGQCHIWSISVLKASFSHTTGPPFRSALQTSYSMLRLTTCPLDSPIVQSSKRTDSVTTPVNYSSNLSKLACPAGERNYTCSTTRWFETGTAPAVPTWPVCSLSSRPYPPRLCSQSVPNPIINKTKNAVVMMAPAAAVLIRLIQLSV